MHRLAPSRRIGALLGTLLLLFLAACGTTTEVPATLPRATAPHPTPTKTSAASAPATEALYIVTAAGTLAVYRLRDGHALWQFQPPASEAVNAVVVLGTVAYVGTDTTLYALSSTTGIAFWTAPVGPAVQTILPTQASIYVGSAGGVVYALSAATGKARWKQQRGRAAPAALLLNGNSLMVETQDGVWALGLTGGQVLWQWTSPAPEEVIQTQLLLDQLLLVQSSQHLLVLSRSDGQLLWQRATVTEGLAIRGDVIDTVYLDQPPATAPTASSSSGIRALRATDGALLWQVQTPPGNETELDVSGPDAFYRLSDPSSGALSAWRLSDGKQVWHVSLGTEVFDLRASGENLYLTEGTAVLALDGHRGKLIWQTPISGGASALLLAGGALVAWDDTSTNGLVQVFDPAHAGAFQWRVALEQQLAAVLVAPPA